MGTLAEWEQDVYLVFHVKLVTCIMSSLVCLLHTLKI